MKYKAFALILGAIALFAKGTQTATAQDVILHSFADSGDGAGPAGGVIFDSKKVNLYGTTTNGGTPSGGTAYVLKPAAGGGWTQEVIYKFGGVSTDATSPSTPLVFDSKGNLYGITRGGGANRVGTVFELSPQTDGSWKEEVIHSFSDTGGDGYYPVGGLTVDSKGNLYGTTLSGGGTGAYGTVYELLPQTDGSWTERILYGFPTDTSGGNDPNGPLLLDAKGNLYGTTQTGGPNFSGLVFELSPSAGDGWTEQILYSFNPTAGDGITPGAGVISDTAGNLYGTTVSDSANHSGIVYKLSPTTEGSWTETILHTFESSTEDGFNPVTTLVFDKNGNLYGTTPNGGTNNKGTVFLLSQESGVWSERLLHSFGPSGADGITPSNSVVLDGSGNIFGTTATGGISPNLYGTVFELESISSAQPREFSPGTGTYTSVQTVTISSATPDTTIYYTTNGATPTTSSTKYTGPVSVDITETIKAIASASGYTKSIANSATYTLQLPAATAPVFSPAAGTYTTAQAVTITDTTPGAVIYYTVDGTTPTAASSKYSTAITVSKTETIEAIAVASGYDPSPVASANYQILPIAASPVFSPKSGSYSQPQTVTITDSTPGAIIHYTLGVKGSARIYTGPITVATTETLYAYVDATGYTQSALVSASYTIATQTATPVLSPTGGAYTATQSVTITDSTSGASIYYTLNGTTPTAASTKYSGPITVVKTETIQAIAIASGASPSAVVSATYTITAPKAAATPVISPAAGTYTTAKTISITDTTSGAAIYYTTNGATPTTASTKYTGAFTITATTTIKAIAIATGYSNSAIASSTYTIKLTTATPTITPAAGTYTTAKTISIADATPGAVLYYTTNGTTPTAASTKYTAPFKITATSTISVIAITSGYANSAVASSKYIIETPAATPVISPAAGTYTTTQTVTISAPTPGSTLYYTTNKTTPTTSSTKYTGPISVTKSETIEAIAVATGYLNSATASATYTIQ